MTLFGLPKTVPYRPHYRPERDPLGRLIELEAAYQVLGAVPYADDAAGFKRKLSMVSRHELRLLVFNVLLRLPARRFR
jgi:hypothetical protein